MTIGADSAKTLDGKATARVMREEVAAGVAELQHREGVTPGLTVVLVGEDPASQIYVRNKQKAATKAGMKSEICRLPPAATERDVLETVAKLNGDPSVHGILVQLPLPSTIDDRKVIEAIDPAKDVDGFHPINGGRLLAGLPGFVPCTPAGVVPLLDQHDIGVAG